jgi:UDP-N-acetylglucosamine:LPS N-acetylglucosamine transferase
MARHRAASGSTPTEETAVSVAALTHRTDRPEWPAVRAVPPARPGATGRSPRVLIVSGSVGAGHDGAARELAARLTAAGAQVFVRDLLAAVPAPIARLLRDGYTGTVGHVPALFELLFQRLEHRGLLWSVEQWVCSTATAAVRRWVDTTGPDVVVSTYPLASQTLGDLRGTGELTVPLLTYLTDPAVHVSWLHPAVDAHLTVTAATADQGLADHGVHCTVAGPLVPHRFAVPLELGELVELRESIGLTAGRPVALLVAGSLGLGDVASAAADVDAAGLTPLVLCGRNERLRRTLSGVPGAVTLGWRSDVHRLMQLADVLVQNAGGLSCTEAMVAGLPSVTYRAIPGHGRANAAVLHEAGLAPWARDRRELAVALHAQLGRDRTPPAVPDPTDLVLAALPADRGRGAVLDGRRAA